jgi:putative membrane protein
MRENIKIAVIGLLMGAAEVVPGVSGGTIAFISGLYERLLLALRQLTPALVLVLRREGLAALWRQIDGQFLLLLFAGMGVSIVVFASGISYLLQHQPIALWAFFCGLVIASTWVMSRQMTSFGLNPLLLVCIGAATGIVITGVVPIALPPTPLFLFLGGAIAVCAWILPGISGSFILLILGLYGIVIEAIKTLDLMVLGIVASGCALGLVCFARVLTRLFKHARDSTLAVLTGFMLGSLVKLWPWKETLAYQLGADGHNIPLVQEPVLPATYVLLTGADPQIELAMMAMVTGFIAVIVLDWLATAGTEHDDQQHG